MAVTLSQLSTLVAPILNNLVKFTGWIKSDGTLVVANEDTPLPVTFTAVTGTGLATEAKQDTGNTALAAIQTATQAVIPATLATAVTPSDSTALTSRAVWVGGTGDLSVRLSGAASTTVVFTAIPAGTLLPMSVVRVMAATTATNINVLN